MPQVVSPILTVLAAGAEDDVEPPKKKPGRPRKRQKARSASPSLFPDVLTLR